MAGEHTVTVTLQKPLKQVIEEIIAEDKKFGRSYDELWAELRKRLPLAEWPIGLVLSEIIEELITDRKIKLWFVQAKENINVTIVRFLLR